MAFCVKTCQRIVLILHLYNNEIRFDFFIFQVLHQWKPLNKELIPFLYILISLSENLDESVLMAWRLWTSGTSLPVSPFRI